MIGGTHNRFRFAPVAPACPVGRSTHTERSRSGVDLSVRYIWAIFAALLLTIPTYAQDEPGPCDPPTDKKVVKLLDEAAKAKDGTTRHAKLKASMEVDPECGECLFQLGLSAYKIGRESGKGYDAALRYFEQLEAKCPQYHSDVPYHMGAIRYGTGDHAGAAKHFEAFRKFPTDDATRMGKNYDKQYKDVEELMPELQFFADFYRNQAPLDPRVLANVSTAADEYFPMLSPDNELLFFTRKSKVKAKGDIVSRDIEELIEARRPDPKADFNVGRALPDPFNMGDNYGGASISVNNKEMFVTVCTPPDARGYRNCDLFRTHYDSKFNLDMGGQEWEWTGLEDLGPNINTPDGWESQPSLSADGRTLYFAANRSNTDGMDILQSTRDGTGNWTKAVPVKGINTFGDEKAPFMHSDSRTLYFAARPDSIGRGHRSMGGYDIFYSRMNDDGTWSKPKNIGHPINTDQDEHGLIVSADGRTAYFASARYKGMGGLDIYGSNLPQEARPDDILVLKGDVRDENGQVVRDATVEIKYMDTRLTETIEVDKADGSYATVLRLKAGDDVVVTVKKADHVFDSRSFSVEDTLRGGSAQVDMTIQKIAVGRSYRVNDIKYATNSATITKSSEYILDELITFLKENPTVKIRIEGHTDNVGRLEDNMVLSNDRAFTVMEYLQNKGIKGARLSFKGMGPTKPLASNDTPEGRAENRRTEFVVVGR
jgi:outer membrane protein OmpA-like peptidoglycan-associated protein/tetratricopeptide (TPR) repeat protein